MENFTKIVCANCGICFAFEEVYRQKLRENKQTFYCPNGHPNVYRKNEADELRERLEREQRNFSTTVLAKDTIILGQSKMIRALKRGRKIKSKKQ